MVMRVDEARQYDVAGQVQHLIRLRWQACRVVDLLDEAVGMNRPPRTISRLFASMVTSTWAPRTSRVLIGRAPSKMSRSMSESPPRTRRSRGRRALRQNASA